MTPLDVIEGRAAWCVVEADCLAALSVLGDAGVMVDHVISDPPFEAAAHTLGRRLKGRALDDGEREVLEAPLSFPAITGFERQSVAAHIARMTRRWAMVFSQVEAVMEWQRVLTDDGALSPRRIGVWVKPDAMPQFSGDRPGMGYESIVFTHRKGRSKWNGGGKVAVFTVAHPPCERWGRYWFGGPSVRVRKLKGDDAGCFAAALAAVRTFGGVLEHPAATHAWAAFNLRRPPAAGGWVDAGDGGWVCHLEQGNYGHPARKATWLYSTIQGPELKWGPSPATQRLDEGFHSAAERRAARAAGQAPRKRLSRAANIATPTAFRDLLISIARDAAGTGSVAGRAS